MTLRTPWSSLDLLLILHRKSQNLSVPHPNRLNHFQSDQRTRRCCIEKDQTHPFYIPTDWTVSHLITDLDVGISKKTKLKRSTSQQTEPFFIWAESSTLLHWKRINQNRSTSQQTEPSQAGCLTESTRLLRNAQPKSAIHVFQKYHKN